MYSIQNGCSKCVVLLLLSNIFSFLLFNFRQALQNIWWNFWSLNKWWRHRGVNRHLRARKQKGFVRETLASCYKDLRLFHGLWDGLRRRIKKTEEVLPKIHSTPQKENISGHRKTCWVRGGETNSKYRIPRSACVCCVCLYTRPATPCLHHVKYEHLSFLFQMIEFAWLIVSRSPSTKHKLFPSSNFESRVLLFCPCTETEVLRSQETEVSGFENGTPTCLADVSVDGERRNHLWRHEKDGAIKINRLLRGFFQWKCDNYLLCVCYFIS